MFFPPVNVDDHVPDLLKRWNLRLVQLFDSHFIRPCISILLLSCISTILVNFFLHVDLLTVRFQVLVIFLFLLVSLGPVDVWRNATDLLVLEAVFLPSADILVVVNSRLIHMLWVKVVLVM